MGRMQDLSGLRSLEGFRSLAGSTSMAMKAANPKPSSDAGGSSYGGFGNIKIATGSGFVLPSVWFGSVLIRELLLISLGIFVWSKRNRPKSRLQ